MKKIKITLKYAFIGISIALLGFVGFVKFILPMVGSPEEIKIVGTKERIERGKYLANSVCVCMDCHSKRDWNKFAGPLVEHTKGMGGEEFNEQMGFPGKYYAKNITPFGIENWSDGEILRAITSGVTNEGKALFPVMPYLNFGKMAKEDIYSIVAYIRTLAPIDNQVPDAVSNFPMNFIVNTIPQKANYTSIPNKKDKVAYGGYILNAAGCAECHTPQENGKFIPGKELAGGFKFPFPNGDIVTSVNITPDIETGIGSWTEERFINTFKSYADSTYKPRVVTKGEFNTVMPWMMYGTMKTEDLKALYAYLRTVKPIKNEVVKFSSK